MTPVASQELRFDDRVLLILDTHLEPRVGKILDRLVKPAAVYTMLAVVAALAIGLFWVWNDNRALYQRVHNAERDLRVLEKTTDLRRALDEYSGKLDEQGVLMRSIAGAVGVEVPASEGDTEK